MMGGVDEAGLGPRVGSLFVGGVCVVGDLSLIRESKQVFRRSPKSYAWAEGLVMSVLERAGVWRENAYDLWCSLFGEGDWIYKGLNLPAFGGRPLKVGFEVLKVSVREVKAPHLRRNRFVKDARAIVEVSLDLLKVCDGVLAGLAGGFRRYEVFLKGWKKEEVEGGYIFTNGGKSVRFERAADAKYKEVALASLIAKYLREIHMLAVNRLVGLEGVIPYASGYPSDGKTRRLIWLLKGKGYTQLLR